MNPPIHIQPFSSLHDYQRVYDEMRNFTAKSSAETADTIWFLQHQPVFTQGQAGKAEHILDPGDIPIIQSDRGGQVTYHGPRQMMSYVLWDIKRLHLGV